MQILNQILLLNLYNSIIYNMFRVIGFIIDYIYVLLV